MKQNFKLYPLRCLLGPHSATLSNYSAPKVKLDFWRTIVWHLSSAHLYFPCYVCIRECESTTQQLIKEYHETSHRWYSTSSHSVQYIFTECVKESYTTLRKKFTTRERGSNPGSLPVTEQWAALYSVISWAISTF